jgi:hypothetical protein
MSSLPFRTPVSCARWLAHNWVYMQARGYLRIAIYIKTMARAWMNRLDGPCPLSFGKQFGFHETFRFEPIV